MTTSLAPFALPDVGIAVAPHTRRRLIVQGVVQGVGFRPFVHRVATALGLRGSVRNDGAKVVIEVVGSAEALVALHDALVHDAPPLARIDGLVEQDLGDAEADAQAPGDGFRIAESTTAIPHGGTAMALTADAGICEQCEKELLDRSDRRYRHAFISCTDCGPRWSMLEALPYDRVRTSMAAFALCARCEREYHDPRRRRFHAESVCCPECGPRLAAFDAEQHEFANGDRAIAAAVTILAAGGIVALHGIGGFHLAVDARNRAAVERLRLRKHRPAKPFAVMVRTVADAHALVELDEAAVRVLRSAERPVLIAAKRPHTAIADNVAPGLAELGVMLPSTAVQHLLLHDLGVPLVMTSGNASGEPLAATPHDAWRDLAGIADLLLMHDRPIVAPSDDTVLRRESRGLVMMRRARGWSPARLTLPVASTVPVLGLGADLKSTVALADGMQAWLSPHLGDQASLAVQERTAEAIARFVALSGVAPAVVACDMHPGYASTAMLARWLEDPSSLPWRAGDLPRVMRIQHHHAHVAAVLVEHGITHPVVALAFDGAGWGPDRTVWGGEVLVADLHSVQRVGALCEAPLIGGDLAAREPWRAALGWLIDYDGVARQRVTETISATQLHIARHLAASVSTMRTSSMGRLFDAAAAVLQVVARNSYEGEAAAALEALASTQPAGRGTAFPFVEPDGDAPWRLDPRPALDRLGERHRLGGSVAQAAAQWHDDVAATSVLAVRRALDEHGLWHPPTVVLCGGVFQNVRLLHAIRMALEAQGVTVLTARTLPPNDGAIAVGQVAIAAATLAAYASHAVSSATFAPWGSND